MSSGLNDSPTFIQALGQIVMDAIATDEADGQANGMSVAELMAAD